MARGGTLGQRRRRRRRERHGGDPDFDPDPPVTSPRRLAEREARALDGSPGWVQAIWATPDRRLALSGAIVAVMVWVLASAVLDRDFLGDRRAVTLVITAPALLAMFGLTGYEAARDLRRGVNSVPTFFRLDRLLLGTRAGRAVLVAYGVLAVAAIVWLPRPPA